MNNLFKSIHSCTNCKLHLNQVPLLDPCESADVMWVGLSAVKTDNPKELPLSETTNTGRLISSIELAVPHVSFYKTNLVKCLPLINDKIRYPSLTEMKQCHFHIDNEIDLLKPKVVFLLGKQVAAFVCKKYGLGDVQLDSEFRYDSYRFGGINFIPVHHPSFILVYKRKKLSEYTDSLVRLIDRSTLSPLDFSSPNWHYNFESIKHEPEYV